MHYVYIIQSVKYSNNTYVGQTANPKKRLDDHNKGFSSHTSKYAPWKLICLIQFDNELKAISFEKYLKTGSGRVFLKRRLLQK